MLRDIEELDYEEIAKTPVSYTHLRAHETVLDLVCRLLLEKKKTTLQYLVIILDVHIKKNTHKQSVLLESK